MDQNKSQKRNSGVFLCFKNDADSTAPVPAMIKFGIFNLCFRGITQLPSSECYFSYCFTLPPCLCPCLQAALCIWGWCSEPSSGVDFQTKWAVNSACWSQWLSMASSPSSPPLSRATACSSFVAWCLDLGEYFFSCEYFSHFKPNLPHWGLTLTMWEGGGRMAMQTGLGTVMDISLFLCAALGCSHA